MAEESIAAWRHEYLQAVGCLLRGEAREAVRLLQPLEGQRADPCVRLALGKAHLELGDGARASRCFEMLLKARSPQENSLRAYVKLLAAAAASLEGRWEDARSHLQEVPQIDPRMERAWRLQLRRIDGNRAAPVRF